MSMRTAGRRSWAVFVAVVACLLVGPGACALAGTFSPVGTPIEGEMEVLTEVRFPLVIERPGTVRITATGEDTLKFRLYLYDVNGTSVLAQETGGHASSRTVERPGLIPGTYFIRLYRTQGQGRYSVQPELAAATTPEDQEPNDTAEQAQVIPLGMKTTGLLGYGNVTGTDVNDWFTVTTTAPGTLRVSAEAEETLSFHLYLYDVNGRTSLAQESSGYFSARAVERAGLAPGTYFIRLYRTQGYGGYALETELVPVAYESDQEPNDSAEQAQVIPLGMKTTGLLGYGNVTGTDVNDWFTVTTTAPGTLRVSAEAEETLSFHLYLYDVNGRTSLAQESSGYFSARAVERAGLAPGTYFIRLYRTQGYGGYALETELVPVAYESDQEPNDTVDLAQEVPLGEATTELLGYGNVEGTDIYDWFKVTTDEPGTLSVSVEAEETLKLQLHLYDVNGRTTLASDTSGHESSRAAERPGLAPGTYLIRLYRSQGYGGYTLTTKLTAATMPGDQEPNDTVDQAQEISLGRTTTGLLGYGNVEGTDNYDWFKVTTDEPGTLSVSVQAEETLKLQLHLYDVNGRTVLASDTSGHESSRAVERTDVAPGTYFVRLYRTQGHGGYRLLPALAPDGPGVEAPGVGGPPAGDPDPVEDPARQPDAPPIMDPSGWMDVRAGDMCLRVPGDWYDNTEAGKRRTEGGTTLLGYWATTQIVQGPGSHFAVARTTKEILERDIAENERDPGMVLVEQHQASLGGQRAEWYAYDMDGQLRMSFVHQASPGPDGLYLSVIAVTELETIDSTQPILQEIFASMGPCPDLPAAADSPPAGDAVVGTISFTLQGRAYEYPAIGQRDPETGATGIMGGSVEAAVSLSFAMVDGPGVFSPRAAGTTFIFQWLAGTPPFSSALGITYMAMPDLFPVQLTISEYGPVGGMIRGTFESYQLEGSFAVERRP